MDKIKELENIYKELVDYIFENEKDRETKYAFIKLIKGLMDEKQYERKLKLFILNYLKLELENFNKLKETCTSDNEIKEILLERIDKYNVLIDRTIALYEKDKKVLN